MNVHAAAPTEARETAAPFAPSRKNGARIDIRDSVEMAGQTIVGLLNKSVEAADANTKHALDVALKLSRELQAAEQRMTDLEADLRHYKDRAERAEKWLDHIASEIEQNFLRRLSAGDEAPPRRKNA
jgi:2-phosphoglycerate kinase